MANNPTVMRASCECGTCVVEAKQAPRVRLNCHCTICQAFTGDTYSDVMVLPASQAVLRNEDQIFYQKYKRFGFPPPNLRRGRCRKCEKPFIETWGFGNYNILLFIRVACIDQKEALPLPEGHLFYEHRFKDINDGIAKHEGYFDSLRALAKMIVHAL
ncbi:GFA family protein [Beijerinckia indica]|uniref:CENP-V/GFA domain-containing protein n=1 Tax=Beijerinckia indica subsp. indica (strain ATCC 9039 / DSM 1715 / NCIMB 8712) TaxID=395963 RepID=B2IIV5_BEII9|nr:GFA family protein [Beijerinckia indica]ACB96167.1 conserved hypothetical protein [Beijerinckia indica subsp. indica ATCC 9039]